MLHKSLFPVTTCPLSHGHPQLPSPVMAERDSQLDGIHTTHATDKAPAYLEEAFQTRLTE